MFSQSLLTGKPQKFNCFYCAKNLSKKGHFTSPKESFDKPSATWLPKSIYQEIILSLETFHPKSFQSVYNVCASTAFTYLLETISDAIRVAPKKCFRTICQQKYPPILIPTLNLNLTGVQFFLGENIRTPLKSAVTNPAKELSRAGCTFYF